MDGGVPAVSTGENEDGPKRKGAVSIGEGEVGPKNRRVVCYGRDEDGPTKLCLRGRLPNRRGALCYGEKKAC